MMNSRGKKQPRIPVTQCTYCGSCDLGIGWQQNEAIVTFRRNGCNRQISRRIKRPPSQRISNEMAVSIFIMV